MIHSIQKRKSCSCHGQQGAGRRPARLGDSSDSTFGDWLGQQDTATQNLFYSYQAANPASPAFTPPLTSASALSNLNWPLIIAATLGAIVVIDLLSSSGGRRR